jgi:N-methylhydantoinase A
VVTPRERGEAFLQIFQALGLSVLLMYGLMALLFESLLYPVIIMLSLPLALVGAFGLLALTGNTLNLMSMIGMILLTGLVGKNAILLVDYTNHLRRAGMARNQALLQAGPTRLRPILMTTCALILAMLPLAMRIGEGGDYGHWRSAHEHPADAAGDSGRVHHRRRYAARSERAAARCAAGRELAVGAGALARRRCPRPPRAARSSLHGMRLALDTGGTFTDVVAFDEQRGILHITKTPSTPTNPALGFMDGVHKIAHQAGFAASDIASVSHGTTVATNALLSEEGSFPGLGLIVTRGFKYLLEIARQSVPQGYGNSYFWVKPERIVAVHNVQEVRERLNFRGDVLAPLDLEEAEAASRWFAERDIDCVGVCFLHAYASGEHEQKMRDVLARLHPRAAVSISSEVLPEYREYERAVTTLVDAFVKPRVGRYVADIQARVENEIGPGTPFYIMKSNGGVISAREVARQPITTLLSGPAAGALGAALLAQTAGFDNVLTLDGGGTSTDVAVVDGGVPHLTTEGRVGRFPVKVPMIDVATVGAGGGSIAWLAQDGRLKVGPRSAGAEPGPMCYSRGGDQPTVTDATLQLDRIPPHLLGGEVPLDPLLARHGLELLATALGMNTDAAAAGILEIAAWSQANAVRQVTVKRGLDVRDYVLVAFGGSGPLQAGRLVDVLGLQAALIPPHPGNVSAFGLLTVDLKNDYVATAVQRDAQLDCARLNVLYANLEADAHQALVREGLSASHMLLVRSADLRYFGQASEVRVDVPAGVLDRAAADVAVDRFHAAHDKTFGYSYRTSRPPHAIEWVNVRVTGIGPIERPPLRAVRASMSGGVERALSGHRRVYFDAARVDTPIYDRARLQPGDRLPGPAILEEFGSTTVVFPSLDAQVDDFGNLLLRTRR